jgi:hypothetical protein
MVDSIYTIIMYCNGTNSIFISALSFCNSRHSYINYSITNHCYRFFNYSDEEQVTMGRNKRDNKNIVVSISLPPKLKEDIDLRPDFNLSKFVQIHLSEYLQTQQFLEEQDGAE